MTRAARRGSVATVDPTPGGVPGVEHRARIRTLGAVALAYGVVMAGTTLPTSIYPDLQREFGLDTAGATQLFATYAVTVLLGLIAFGAISDRAGRRAVLMLGLAAAIGSGIAYAAASSTPTLFLARAISGLSAALVTGTATAYLVDMAARPRRGSAIASAANMIGLGCGPMLAAVVAWLIPLQPGRAPFVVHAGLSALACGALLFADDAPRTSSGRAVRVVLPSVPRELLRRFLRASAASVGFIVMGACTAITAILITAELDSPSILVVGAAGSMIFLATAAGQLIGARLGGRWRTGGFTALFVGLLAMGAAPLLDAPSWSIVVYVLGLVSAGCGHGVLFPHALALTVADVPSARRAQASTAYWCVAYAFSALGAVMVGALCGALGEHIGVSAFAVAMLLGTVACAAASRGLTGAADRPRRARGADPLSRRSRGSGRVDT